MIIIEFEQLNDKTLFLMIENASIVNHKIQKNLNGEMNVE